MALSASAAGVPSSISSSSGVESNVDDELLEVVGAFALVLLPMIPSEVGKCCTAVDDPSDNVSTVRSSPSEVPFLHLAKFSLSVRIIFYLQIKFNVSFKKFIKRHKINLLYNTIFCIVRFIV